MRVTLKHGDNVKLVDIPDVSPTPRVIYYNGRMYLNTIDIHIYSTVPFGQVIINEDVVAVFDRDGKEV